VHYSAAPKNDWPYSDVIKKVRNMGSKIEMKNVKGVTRCKKYNVFSTPAWLYKHATYSDVHQGIGKLVTMLKRQMSK
jgi:enhancing lycopene biosynthesis protein 2